MPYIVKNWYNNYKRLEEICIFTRRIFSNEGPFEAIIFFLRRMSVYMKN
jgi:hypothetical protein